MAPSSTPGPEMSPRCPRAMTPGWWETSRSSSWTGSAPATTRAPERRRGLDPAVDDGRAVRPGQHVRLGSAEDEPEDLRGGQHVVGRVADARQLDEPVPGGEPGRAGKPADMLVVVQAAVEAVRALR